MAYAQRTQMVIANQPHGQMMVNPFCDYNQQWTVGLCDCFNDVGQCCYAYFCWCCFIGSLAKSINESTASCLCGNPLAAYRMKVRATFKIQGDSYDDACAVCCCPFCTALQMRNELRNRGFP